MTAYEMIQKTAAAEEYREYHSPRHDAELQQLVTETWGENCQVPGAYEIAFRSLVDAGWEKNPNYLPPDFRKQLDFMPAGEMKARMLRDPEFAARVELLGKEEASRNLTSTDPYQTLTAEGFRSIPPAARASMLQGNVFFRAAVERLREKGEL